MLTKKNYLNYPSRIQNRLLVYENVTNIQYNLSKISLQRATLIIKKVKKQDLQSLCEQALSGLTCLLLNSN